MTEVQASAIAVTEDMPAVDDYRQLSVPAVLTLLAGLASGVALVHPLLAVVPLATVVLAVVALRSIAAGEGRLAGTWLAVAGLAMAIVFMGWSISAGVLHRWVVRHHAREFVDDWLSLLTAGELRFAHQLHADRGFRVDPYIDMEQAYKMSEDAQSDYRNFYMNEVLDELRMAGKNANPRFETITRHFRVGLGEEIELRYAFNARQGPKKVWIVVRRQYSTDDGISDWVIYAVRDHARPID